MIRDKTHWRALLAALGLLFIAADAGAQGTQPAPVKAGSGTEAAKPDQALEPKAVDVLKAMGARLAAARSMAFTAVITYESPSRLGPPLAYTTRSDVVVQRPNKLRVVTPGDGGATEFYYDGETMAAFAPAENLVAVAKAPPSIDATLKAAFETAAIYFPFTDLVVADPFAGMAEGLTLAFYVGQSQVVGGTKTDIVAYASAGVFVQLWIGADDKLPRKMRAIYQGDRAQLRHDMELSNWQLDQAVAADAFASPRAATATKVEFARPDPQHPARADIKPKRK